MTCPSPNEIRNCLIGRLSQPQADAIFAHVEACAECSQRVEQLESELAEQLSDSPQATDQRLPPAELLLPLLQTIGERQADNRESTATARESAVTVNASCQAMMAAASSLMSVSTGSTGAIDTQTLPRRLRDYELREVIGHGGMGIVYRGWHDRLQREVAVKVLHASRENNAQALQHFHREMAAVGRLNHPNIVRAQDAGVSAGTHYLVMDLLEGVNAAALVRTNGRLPIAAACSIIHDAAQGLAHAHAQSFIHRDVKPSNIMVTKDGRALLMDMGLALAMSEFANSNSPDKQRESRVLGTPDYIAPEQAGNSHTVDAAADVYSLGCTLYHLLSGSPPFEAADIARTIRAHKNSQPRPLVNTFTDHQTSDGSVHPSQESLKSLSDFVRRMMAKSPTERPTITEVIEQMRPRVARDELPSLVTETQWRLPRRTAYSFAEVGHASQVRPTRWVRIAVAGSLLAMAILVAFFLYTTRPTADSIRNAVHAATANPPAKRVDPALLALVSGTNASETREVAEFIRGTDGTRTIETLQRLGNQVFVSVFRGGSDRPPTKDSLVDSVEAWDLLELKLKQPELFERIRSMWETGESGASTPEPVVWRVIERHTLRVGDAGNYLIESQVHGQTARLATNRQAAMVVRLEGSAGQPPRLITVDAPAGLAAQHPEAAQLYQRVESIFEELQE